MYIGRIVAIARTKDNRGAALYRVSSRSFPNRMAKTLANAVAIVPKPGFENDIQKNPTSHTTASASPTATPS